MEEIVVSSKNISEVTTQAAYETKVLNDVRAAFRKFDRDGDGVITIAEMQSCIDSFGFIKLSPSDLKEMLRESDVDGNGSIDFEEFMQIMMKNRSWAKYHTMTPEERFTEGMRIRRQSSYQDQLDFHEVGSTQLSDYIAAMKAAESAKTKKDNNPVSASGKDFIGTSDTSYYQSAEILQLKTKRRKIHDLCHRICSICIFDQSDPDMLDTVVEQLTAIKNELLSEG